MVSFQPPRHVTQCNSRDIDVFLGFYAQEEGKKACVNTQNTHFLILRAWTWSVTGMYTGGQTPNLGIVSVCTLPCWHLGQSSGRRVQSVCFSGVEGGRAVSILRTGRLQCFGGLRTPIFHIRRTHTLTASPLEFFILDIRINTINEFIFKDFIGLW